MVGTSARLRFAYTEPATALTLELSMIAIEKGGAVVPQQVEIVANGALLDTVTLDQPTPQQFSLPLRPRPIASSSWSCASPTPCRWARPIRINRFRSIKLLSAALLPA